MTEEWHLHTEAEDLTYHVTDKLFEALKLIREVSDILDDESLLNTYGTDSSSLVDTLLIEEKIMEGLGRTVFARKEIEKNHPKE